MHYSRIRGLAVQAGVCLRANETEISAALWAKASWHRRDFTLLSVKGRFNG